MSRPRGTEKVWTAESDPTGALIAKSKLIRCRMDKKPTIRILSVIPIWLPDSQFEMWFRGHGVPR